MTTVLPLFDPRGGLNERVAEAVAEGARLVPGEVADDDRTQVRELGRHVAEFAQRLFP